MGSIPVDHSYLAKTATDPPFVSALLLFMLDLVLH